MKLDHYHTIYFIGIGGAGMSALARWFVHNGFRVAGYDLVPTPLTSALAAEGIDIGFEDDVAQIPAAVTADSEKALIVVTPAIPKDHRQYNFFLTHNFPMLKRAQVLGILSSEYYLIAVAGTHGKTTTSSMIAHLLKNAGKNIVAFLGGVATNYDTNFIAGEKNSGKPIAIVEADEFDRSFLSLYPDVAVITSADADHLDIYGDKKHLEDSFKDFIRQIKAGGKLFIHEQAADNLIGASPNKNTRTYGIDQGFVRSSNITVEAGTFRFDYHDGNNTLKGLSLCVPGFHNVENATAAIAVALGAGLTLEEVREGIAGYKGVKRRFEYVIKSEKIIFVDDYAHHPVEIRSFLRSLRALFPARKITAVFQPHLFTRTRDFADDFAESLDLADEVILLDIYPARELPIKGVTSVMIFDKIKTRKMMMDKSRLPDYLESHDPEVISTIGAGDIDKLVNPIKQRLMAKYHV